MQNQTIYFKTRGREQFVVTKLVNIMSPEIGDHLAKHEVQEIINGGTRVIVTGK